MNMLGNLMQTASKSYSYSTTTTTPVDSGALAVLAGFWVVYSIIVLAVAVVSIIGMWKVFEKCGEDGWKAIIPFYNLYTAFKLFWQPKFFWITILCLFPGILLCGLGAFAAIVFIILLYNNWRKCFGYGAGFAVGLVFLTPVFVCINGFDKSKYLGNVNDNSQNTNGNGTGMPQNNNFQGGQNQYNQPQQNYNSPQPEIQQPNQNFGQQQNYNNPAQEQQQGPVQPQQNNYVQPNCGQFGNQPNGNGQNSNVN